jgi:hypothetical protein
MKIPNCNSTKKCNPKASKNYNPKKPQMYKPEICQAEIYLSAGQYKPCSGVQITFPG